MIKRNKEKNSWLEEEESRKIEKKQMREKRKTKRLKEFGKTTEGEGKIKNENERVFERMIETSFMKRKGKKKNNRKRIIL